MSGRTKKDGTPDKRRGQNSLWKGDNSLILAEGETKEDVLHRALEEATRYLWIDPVKNNEQARERIEEYFNHCLVDNHRPTVEGLAMCMGVTRATLFDWETGHTHTVASDIIKRAKEVISTYDADLVASGKLNPVVYIFRSKNYYGMKDQTETIVTPNVQETPREQLIQDAELLP